MAERPYFYVTDNYISRRLAEFEWFPGFAVSQKQKCIASFHFEIQRAGLKPLEVSTKSRSELGKRLSAFNLRLNDIPLECVFQGSKVFAKGGPYEDLYGVSPKDAKRDERLKVSGNLVGFRYQGINWELTPKTAFYDYIYYQAVRQSLSEAEWKELGQYDAFTDIEFNPNKSLNTQARSAALAVFLYRKYEGLPELPPEEFLQLHKAVVK